MSWGTECHDDSPGLSPRVARVRTDYAALGFSIHPHQLRHACGYTLANDKQVTRAIQLFLEHRNIQHTVKYTGLAAGRFQDFWRDED
jgi:type 1 fimbriae regulatory protein FimB/type 1 fimbriae regulatory protein FimE